MRRFLLAFLGCLLAAGPAAASASDPVTWGAVATIGAYVGFGILALIVLAIILIILFALIGGFNDWSH